MSGIGEWIGPGWWSRLRVQQKVWTILLMVFVPLAAALIVQVTLVNQLLAVQEQYRQTVLAHDRIHVLRRLVVTIEDGFRGYLLTRQERFLTPMEEAESRLAATEGDTMIPLAEAPGLAAEAQAASRRLAALLESKHDLIRRFKAGREEEVLQYVRSGQGLALSDALRDEFRAIEDRLDGELKRFEVRQAELAQRAFRGLLAAVAGGLLVGFLGARLLTRSITGPLGVLRESVTALGGQAERSEAAPIAIRSSDEIGQLARAFEEMAGRIRQSLKELEAINAIGHEINMIGPDGLEGVLWRITQRAAELLRADVCLVMLHSEKMGCWIIEAASGDWNERLRKSVMLWEEFPISVEAFETRRPAFGEDLRSDMRPEVVRRNLIGQSMLSVPLLSRGEPFGVLVLLQNRPVRREEWNLRLAKGFADEAAVAIANAHLYEAAQQKEKGLEQRLRQLEHLAETLAHDLKGPGERMEGLASVLLAEYGGKLDERATKWLRLIEQNGRQLIERVENILEVARIGGHREAVQAVDPALALDEVLKSRAGDLDGRRVQVHYENGLPMVACHRAYLRQVLDNLISNSVKFCGDRPDSEIRITAERQGDRVRFSVSDNGVGIPPKDRERVFEPFVRLNPAMAQGSGIGLAIVKRIVELYGGRVWVESNEPAGSTFRFTLPVLADFSLGTSPAGETGTVPGAIRPAVAADKAK
ncbi:MAG: ATP-binding protein [Nitrospirota bacterium]